MARHRYWKLGASETEGLRYDEGSLVNWEVKCPLRSDPSRLAGVFLYRRGTPYDYEAVKGVCMYHSNLEKDEIGGLVSLLSEKFGGKREEKGSRVFLKGSREEYGPAAIAALARDLEEELGGEAVISLEFEGCTPEGLAGAGLPEAKLLPIPGG